MPNNYILTSDGSFISEDEYLQHWGLKKGEEKKDHKYIRREWNGKRWIYYYDNGKGNSRQIKGLTKLADWAGADEKKRMEDAKADRATASRRVIVTKNAADEAWRKSAVDSNKYGPRSSMARESFASANMSELKYSRAQRKYDDAKLKYELTVASYYNTPIGKLDKAINTGRDFINSVIRKIRG